MAIERLPAIGQAQRAIRSLSDDELLRRLADLLHQSRRVEADLVAHIAEVEERRLYAREGAKSMFIYCTEMLHLSEHEAYLRIAVARASRRHPVLLVMLADGRLHLSGIELLAPHLTPVNTEALLQRAVHKSKQAIKELVAELKPKPDVPASIRKLPDRWAANAPGQLADGTRLQCPGLGPVQGPPPNAETANDALAPAALQLGPDPVPPPMSTGAPLGERAQKTGLVEPLGLRRYKVQFTASAAFRDKLEKLRALMRPSVPDGDLAAILEAAVTEKLQRLEARRFGRTQAPRKSLADADTSASGSRYIPTPVRRVVDDRDGRQCCYVSPQGRRCSARSGLEFHHHAKPHARGGDRSSENLRLMCSAHNAYLAEIDFGKDVMARHRRPRAGSEPLDPG